MISCLKNFRISLVRMAIRSISKPNLFNFSTSQDVNSKEELENLFYKTNFNLSPSNIPVLKPKSYEEFTNMIKEDKAVLVLYLAPYFNSDGVLNVLSTSPVSKK